jgi:hypothetical protein
MNLSKEELVKYVRKQDKALKDKSAALDALQGEVERLRGSGGLAVDEVGAALRAELASAREQAAQCEQAAAAAERERERVEAERARLEALLAAAVAAPASAPSSPSHAPSHAPSLAPSHAPLPAPAAPEAPAEPAAQAPEPGASEETVEALKDKLARQASQLKELLLRYKKLQGKATALQTALDAAAGTRGDKAEPDETAERQLEATEAERAALCEQLSELTERQRGQELRQQAVEAEAASLRAQLAAAQLAASQSRSSQEELVALQRAVRAAEQESHVAQERLAALVSSSGNAAEELQLLRHALAAQAAAREAETADLQGQLTALASARSDEVSALQGQLLGVQRELQSQVADAAGLRQQLAASSTNDAEALLKQRVQELQDDLAAHAAASEAVLVAHRQAAEANRLDCEGLRQQLAGRDSRESSSSSGSSSSSDHEEALAALAATHQAELDSLRSSLGAAHEGEVEALRASLSLLQERLQLQVEAFESATAKIAASEQRVGEEQRLAKEWERKCAELAKRFKALKSKSEAGLEASAAATTALQVARARALLAALELTVGAAARGKAAAARAVARWQAVAAVAPLETLREECAALNGRIAAAEAEAARRAEQARQRKAAAAAAAQAPPDFSPCRDVLLCVRVAGELWYCVDVSARAGAAGTSAHVGADSDLNAREHEMLRVASREWVSEPTLRQWAAAVSSAFPWVPPACVQDAMQAEHATALRGVEEEAAALRATTVARSVELSTYKRHAQLALRRAKEEGGGEAARRQQAEQEEQLLLLGQQLHEAQTRVAHNDAALAEATAALAQARSAHAECEGRVAELERAERAQAAARARHEAALQASLEAQLLAHTAERARDRELAEERLATERAQAREEGEREGAERSRAHTESRIRALQAEMAALREEARARERALEQRRAESEQASLQPARRGRFWTGAVSDMADIAGDADADADSVAEEQNQQQVHIHRAARRASAASASSALSDSKQQPPARRQAAPKQTTVDSVLLDAAAASYPLANQKQASGEPAAEPSEPGLAELELHLAGVVAVSDEANDEAEPVRALQRRGSGSMAGSRSPSQLVGRLSRTSSTASGGVLAEEEPGSSSNNVPQRLLFATQFEYLQSQHARERIEWLREIEQLRERCEDGESRLRLLEQQNELLKEEIREAQRAQERSARLGMIGEPPHGTNAEQQHETLTYLKNVVHKFLVAKQTNERRTLLPVVATMLQFSPQETAQARAAIDAEASATTWFGLA